SALSSILPGKSRRASSQATAMPGGRLASTLQKATFRLSVTASHSTDVSSGMGGPRGLVDRQEAEVAEDAAGLGGAAEGQQGGRSLRIRAAGGDRGRVDDRVVARCGNAADDPDIGFGRRVRSVDDAERRLPAGDEGERDADIFGP